MNNVFNQAYDTVICIGNSKHYLAHLNELEYARCVIAEPDKNSAKKLLLQSRKKLRVGISVSLVCILVVFSQQTCLTCYQAYK